MELHAAASLARLLRDPSRPADAPALLDPAYDRCSEGFETADGEIGKKPFLTPSAMANKSKRSGSGRYADMTDDLKELDHYGSRRRGLGESEAAAALDRPADGGVDY